MKQRDQKAENYHTANKKDKEEKIDKKKGLVTFSRKFINYIFLYIN